MAHPLRLRILRLCLHEPLTNKEIADRLGQDPATTLHHVRLLVRTGFLEAEEVRTGGAGRCEKPYRATGKSWILSVPQPEDQMTSASGRLDAAAAEVTEAGPQALVVHAGGDCSSPTRKSRSWRPAQASGPGVCRSPADAGRHEVRVGVHRPSPPGTAQLARPPRRMRP